MPDIEALLSSRPAAALLGAVVGALLTSILTAYRNRLQLLEYWVHHERVAFAAEDPIFGNVRVTWQGTDVANLFVTTVTVANNSSSDYTDLRLKVYTGKTLLLTERGEVAGTTFVPKWTDEFQERLRVPQGATPTEQQFEAYWHSREYAVPVLNRGQRAVFSYLTSVPGGQDPPLAWVDLLHKGTQIVFREPAHEIHGVPVRLALPLGLVICTGVLLVAAFLTKPPWAAALLCLLAGLFAQSLGAFTYRAARYIKRTLLP
jgi:hypothetical protein